MAPDAQVVPGLKLVEVIRTSQHLRSIEREDCIECVR